MADTDSVLARTRLSHCGGWPPRTSLKTRGPTQRYWRELLVRREVAAELVGDLPHERDLVAEAFRCCHDVTPSMRVSAPVTLPKPSDKPARKPYKARGSAASGLPDPGVMPGQAGTTATVSCRPRQRSHRQQTPSWNEGGGRPSTIKADPKHFRGSMLRSSDRAPHNGLR